MKHTKRCTICDITYETRNERSVACCRDHLSEWRRRTYKGRKFTVEHNSRLSVAKRRENVRREGDYECDVCRRKFDSNTSLRSHRSYCSSSAEPTDVACEECGEVFKRRRGLLWHVRSHQIGFFEEHSRKTSKGLEAAKPRKRNSDAEIAFQEVLERVHGVGIVHKFRIDGINHEFDFFVPAENTVVEFDGDYWHGNPTHHELTPKMKRQYRLDESYTRAAETRGYAVRRVWASEAVNYPDKLRKI